jgi:hypothetical protein
MEAAAHKPHGRKHRGRDVLLEDARNGRPAWVAREREIYLAGVQNRIEAARRAVREPPRGDVEVPYFSTKTPWLVPEPKPIRVAVASLVRDAESSNKSNAEVAIRLKELAEMAKRNNRGMALGLFVEAGEHYLRARFFARMARAGEMFAEAAALAKNKSGASGLRERSGDSFSRALDGAEGGYTTRHGDARKQYELAANLVRKTNPGRAAMLDAKADKESGRQDFVGTYEQVTGRPEPQYGGYLGF